MWNTRPPADSRLDLERNIRDRYLRPSEQSFEGLTLKDILESEVVWKVIFDVRNDADALFSHFQIYLRGVVDLQLLEYFQPGRRGMHLLGLQDCVEQHSGLRDEDLRLWKLSKKAGLQFLTQHAETCPYPSQQRPLSELVLKYCSGDVQYLLCLYEVYCMRLPKQAWKQIRRESRKRIQQSQQPAYDPQGKNKWKGPPRYADHSSGQAGHLVPPHERPSKQAIPRPRPSRGDYGAPSSNVERVGSVESATTTGESPSMDLLMRELDGLQLALCSPSTSSPLRHRPVAFVKEGSRPRRRTRGQASETKTYDTDHEFLCEDLDWKLCDKDCGWCGRCHHFLAV